MIRSTTPRVEDIVRLQRAVEIAIASDAALVPALVASTGLSPAGVRLALSNHVELRASNENLERFVALAGDASRVTVVLSSNVFVGAFRAILFARAASTDVVVRPSRRSPVFAHTVVQAAKNAGDTTIRMDESLPLSGVEHGEIHVYGHDETIHAIRAQTQNGVIVRGHGSGLGVALVSPHANLAVAAEKLALDIAVFDQQGCLSPRIALVMGEASSGRAQTFANALHYALTHVGEHVMPRGAVPSEARAEITRYVTTMAYAGTVIAGADHAIGIATEGAPLLLPPPYRTLHVALCRSADEAAALLSPLAHGILMMGSDDVSLAARLAPKRARIAHLGAMQTPPLDGPVDLRTYA